MTIDTRTDAERRYDAQRLSRMPIADQAQPHADKPLSAAEETILNHLLSVSRANGDTKTPLVTLANGATIVGTHERDGSANCVLLEAGDGHFYYDGVAFAGDWADFYVEEMTLDQAMKLRAFFASDMMDKLIDAAKSWCKPA